VTDDDLQDAATELARSAVAAMAAEELAAFDDAAAGFWADPAASSQLIGPALLTPVALGVAAAVMQSLAQGLAQPILDRLWRKLKRGRQDSQPVELSEAELRRVREVAYERGLALGLEPERAGLLADAVIGALTTPQP
jgi:hypothetical protein